MSNGRLLDERVGYGAVIARLTWKQRWQNSQPDLPNRPVGHVLTREGDEQDRVQGRRYRVRLRNQRQHGIFVERRMKVRRVTCSRTCARFRGPSIGSFRTARSISAQFLNQDGTGLLARELRAAFCYLAPGHTTKGIMSGPIAA